MGPSGSSSTAPQIAVSSSANLAPNAAISQTLAQQTRTNHAVVGRSNNAHSSSVPPQSLQRTNSAMNKGPSSKFSVVVSPRQRGNPILQGIKNVPWEFGDIVPDYVLGATSCALFLSLKYHNLNPEYIYDRLKTLGKAYTLRVLLVLVDVQDPHHPLKELAKMAILSDLTLVPAWSSEEAGRYLELYKSYENKPADMIKAQTQGDQFSKFTEAITTVRPVNKTDARTLITNYGSFSAISQAAEEDLALLPGFGVQKAKRLSDMLHQPFLRSKIGESAADKAESQAPQS